MRLHYLGKLHFCHWLAISLLLHVSLALPFLLGSLHWPDQGRQEKLQVETFGMIANRQTEEKYKGAEEPKQAKPEVQPVNNPLPRPQEKYLTKAAESPVQVKKEEYLPVSAPVPVVFAAASGAAVEQRQQTISYEAAKRAYMARVAKQVWANLVYPRESWANKGEFYATIAFTITASGEIRESSLRVVKSSGYAALDASALKAARVSAPFEPPPEELGIEFDVSFDR